MKKFLKWLAIVLGTLLGVIIIALAVFYVKGNAMIKRPNTFVTENIPIPTEAVSIERGRHFVRAICADCHQDDLAGKILLDAPFAKIYTANLTPGKGGAGSDFTDPDWVRAIRHGVDDKGRNLVVMPSLLFWNFNDQDLGEIIAYLKSLPPVDSEHPDPQINPLGKIMFGAGLFGPAIIPADVIAHSQRPPVVPVGVNPQYGKLPCQCQRVPRLSRGKAGGR